MAHHHEIRKDKTCLNCGHIVEDRYCPHCGQENIETRHPFHYLFTHFMEDLLHYDGDFWTTMKDLIRRPGKLTLTYLSGQRKKYVVPVKLYIFVSFVAFFLPGILPNFGNHNEVGEHKHENADSATIVNQNAANALAQLESLHQNGTLSDSSFLILKQKIETELKSGAAASHHEKEKEDDEMDKDFDSFGELMQSKEPSYMQNNMLHGAKTKAAYDSIEAQLPKDKQTNFFLRQYAYKCFQWNEEGISSKELKEKLTEHLIHQFPKVIFIYMPLFAFLLWLVENKKKFWYFDCGIFTLHYFSFLLLMITLNIIMGWLSENLNFTLVSVVFGLGVAFSVFYMIYYFFKAHYRVFRGAKMGTIGKGILLFWLNMIFILVFLCGYVAWMIYLLH